MIIGMVGLIGSGKGTVGDYLHQKKQFIKESFAKPLKDAASIIFNWPRNLLEGDTEESRNWRNQVDQYWSEKLGWKVTPRDVLQKLGTESGRQVFGEGLWTASLINRLESNKNYVITDVRFENEINAIRSVGGILVRVMRGEEPEWISYAQDYLKNFPNEPNFYFKRNDNSIEKIHISEYGWVNSEMDHIVFNNRSLESLYMQVDYILQNNFINYYQNSV